MRRGERIRTFALGSATLLAIAVLGARPFVGSWTRALVYGLPAFGAIQLFGFWDRRRAARALERRYGRITVRGPVLSFEDPPGTVATVHASDMRELWYQYSVFGWSGANNWKLVYDAEQARREIIIHEGSDEQILEPLRAWCIRRLPGFDRRTFDRLAGSLGDDDEPDVLIWARQDR